VNGRPVAPWAGPDLPKLLGLPAAVLLAVTKDHHCPPSARAWPLGLAARTCHQYIVAGCSATLIVQSVAALTSTQFTASQTPGRLPTQTW